MDVLFVGGDLYRTRNMRLGFKSGLFFGGIKAALMTMTGGAFPGRRIRIEPDASEPRRITPAAKFAPEKDYTFDKMDAVFSSGNNTRGDIPSHLIAAGDVPTEVAEFYQHMCPAGVYEVRNGKLIINQSDCVDCKTTDILGPRWTPREAGAGTKYERM